jgi:membrane associated rhomboid family serine protease
MYQQVFSIFGIGLLTGLFAVATIIGTAMRIDKDPAVDGPRALIAEFFGLWFAFAFLAYSFMAEDPMMQWILRGIAATAAIVGFVFAAFFAGTPEVRVRLDQEPTGFETPITTLELHQTASNKTASIDGTSHH